MVFYNIQNFSWNCYEEKKDLFLLLSNVKFCFYFSYLGNEEIVGFFHITYFIWRYSKFLLAFDIYIFPNNIWYTHVPFGVSEWLRLCIHQEQEVSNLTTSDFRLTFPKGHRNWLIVCVEPIGEGNGNPLQCSCLENPRDGGAWWAAVYGITQSRTRLKWLSSMCWA